MNTLGCCFLYMSSELEHNFVSRSMGMRLGQIDMGMRQDLGYSSCHVMMWYPWKYVKCRQNMSLF